MQVMGNQSLKLGEGVDDAVDRVRSQIYQRLREVEEKRNLRVVFACESGSRAWGFASADSDFDVRFIFVRPAEAYLRLHPPADAFDLHSPDDFDLAGWDIRKTAELMRKSNPPLLEWLDSPIIYEADGVVSARLIALREIYFDAKKSAYHYLSMASRIWDKYLADAAQPVRKKYLYVLRPLACIRFIALHKQQPPTQFVEVLDRIDWSIDQLDAVGRLIESKRENQEMGAANPDPVLNELVVKNLQEADSIAAGLPVNHVSMSELDKLVREAILE